MKMRRWQKAEGVCDRCACVILHGSSALCFHGEGHKIFLCEPCIEIIRLEFIEEDRSDNEL